MSAEEQRSHIHQALSELPEMDDDLTDGCYLKSWVAVMVYADPDGGEWFVTRRGTDGGERDLMPWDEKGLIAHLSSHHTRWDLEDAEDDEEEDG